MKKITLLDTSIGSLNQGDEIINVSIKKNWPELFKENYVVKMATHTPMYTPLQSMLYRKKLSVIKNCDVKILCGTNALYTNMLRPLPTWNINILNCGLAKGTVCLGTGIGINSNKVNLYTRKLYQKVLSHKYVHSARDEKTKVFLENLGFKAINTGCPTLWGLTPEFCAHIPRIKSKNVVFTLTYYSRDNINDKRMVEILVQNYDKVFFWPQCIKDLEYLQSLGIEHQIEIICPNIFSFDLVLEGDIDYVGNRLHGGIYALQHYCRTIIIAIDYRAREMRKNYAFECIERENIVDCLEEKINSVWETRICGLDFKAIEKWKRQIME